MLVSLVLLVRFCASPSDPGQPGQRFRKDLTSRWSPPLAVVMTSSQHAYEVRPRKDKRGFDLISDALPFGRLWSLYLVESQMQPLFVVAF